MAPLNPNATDRIKVTYQNAVASHTVLIRIAGTGAVEDAYNTFQDVLDGIGARFAFSEVTGVEFAALGSDIFNPITAPGFDGLVWGADPANKDDNPVAATFVGRSGAGRRAKFSLFGWKDPLSEYRVTSGELPGIEAAVIALNAAETNFLAIDGQPVIWKAYADLKANDHWVGQSRG